MDHQKSKPLPQEDIISRSPIEITFHILSFLSDAEKVTVSSICKTWEQRVKAWQESHSKQISAKYASILPNATFNWEMFKQAARTSAQRPSPTPSGMFKAGSMKADIKHAGRYVAWVERDDLYTATLSTTRLEKDGIQNASSASISGMLNLGQSKFEAHVLHVDAKDGVAIVCLWRTVIRRHEGFMRTPDYITIVAGFFGFDINEQRIIWKRDMHGNITDLNTMPEEQDPDYYFPTCHQYSQRLIFSDGMFIKATQDIATRKFELWTMDFGTGEQKCILKDMLGHSEFDFTRAPDCRHEPRGADVRSVANYRGSNYRADRFDIKPLPFTNADGKREYALVSWSYDFTSWLQSPQIIADEPDQPDGAADNGAQPGPHDTDMPDAPAGAPAGPQVPPPDLIGQAQNIFMQALLSNMEDDGEAPDVIAAAAQNMAQMMMMGQIPAFHPMMAMGGGAHMFEVDGDDDPDDPDHAHGDGEGSKPTQQTHLLIINTTTGKVVQYLALPTYMICLDEEEEKKDMDFAEIADIVCGRHPDQIRYPIGLRLDVRDLVDRYSDPTKETVLIDIVQETSIQRLVTLFPPPVLPFILPEAWSLALVYNKEASTKDDVPTFTFERGVSRLYKIIGGYHEDGPMCIDPNPIKFIINPLYEMALYNCQKPERPYQGEPGNPHNPPPDPALRARYEAEMAVVPEGADILAELLEFSEQKEYQVTAQPDPEQRLFMPWDMKVMQVSARKPIFEPKKEGGLWMRIGWKLSRSDPDGEMTEPLGLDERGMRFGGCWLW
ncbi:hypothetical protein BJ508DRAFT_418687, partial [Ascobolus immersus RN42]